MTAKDVFGDWRLQIFWIAMVAAALIAGFSFGWAWRDRAGALAQVSILSAMTAFGTVGTAIAAVAVPYYQNRARLREQRYKKLLVEWPLALDTHRLSHRLDALSRELLDTWTIPSSSEIEHIYSQLELAKQAATRELGRLIVDDLLYQLIVLKEEARSRAQLRPEIRDAAMAAGNRPEISAKFERSSVRIKELHQRTYNWMERILAEFDQIKMQAPNVVKGAAHASLQTIIQAQAAVVRSARQSTAVTT